MATKSCIRCIRMPKYRKITITFQVDRSERMTIAWLNVYLKATLRADDEAVLLGLNEKHSFGALPEACSRSNMGDNSF